MRLRKKWWARPEMEQANFFITEPKEYLGKWNNEFGNDNEIYLELGCGRGKFITDSAMKNSDINYIGIDLKDEVLIYGKRTIEELKIPNVRLIPLNISMIEGIFAKDEINRIYINFCNPWPKLKHNKRRLTHTRFLNEYKKFLKPGSQIWFKTDNVELFHDSKEYFQENGFEIKFITEDLHQRNLEENIITEYEAKFTGLGMNIMCIIAIFKENME